MSLAFVKVGFHHKLTVFLAFEDHLPFQKYRRPSILVRFLFHEDQRPI
jgi:hypothetical protein